MTLLPESHLERKRDHHRPFIGPDGTLRLPVHVGGWRHASAAEAILAVPNTRRLSGFRDEG